ncbi:Heat shock -like protein SSE1 [Babesia sp. Xinjiang]|uniref:Heat shock -like protein SSE1 n=1 Tax=Babesia sp. Xinjiang TaxID=462227 RepID=UPI000A22E1FE|nr:Heat shock -like protein SSE1 [Babesia sp. Xinjiang]XP_028871606.1 Heat shock -like protein SSE1 [Babesia sp. Xinjiang]ORM41102.1 Heat shock -like protein SSE1 [Babesia sp. Xinjiang]ORM41150.1 Heat shock -like protein SSE1 [Babesia sp. Xinjiang]
MATVGVDLGGFTSKVCVSWAGSDTIELHVNRVSNRETPTIVAYDKRIRIYGEEADLRSSSLYSSSICLLPYIVGLSSEDLLNFIQSRRYLFSLALDQSSTESAFQVKFNDQQCLVEPRDILAFFINRLLETVRKHLGSTDLSGNNGIMLSVPVPVYFTEAQCLGIRNSLAPWGFGGIKLFKQTECLLRRWCDSHLPDVFDEFTRQTGQPSMHVALLDVGFCHCTFFVAEITKNESFEHRIVAEESNDHVGTFQMIEKLADNVCRTIESKKGETTAVPSRQAFNIYKGCAKALKELSVVSEVKIDCERVLSDGDDFSMMVARSQFEELCAPLKETLEGMMHRVLEPVPSGSMLAIEVIGGGSRVPFVKALATEVATSHGAPQVVRMSLDSTSAVASGAVSLAKADAPTLLDGVSVDIGESEVSAAVAREECFSTIENEEFRKRAVLNEIDQYVIKTRNDARGDFSQHIQLQDVDLFLSKLEEFALDAASDKAVSASACELQLNECRENIKAKFPGYISALEEAVKARESEMARAAVTDDISSISGVNMDVTLPKATCIKRAAKNKDEGNALVAGGNIEMAAQHYVKALQYCSKVNDANDEERTQLDTLKLASNLNLAMCYIKMDTQQSYKKAVSCCTQALEISADSTKALYRRAFAYDKLNQLDDALSDARLGVSKFPDNADLKQLLACLEKKAKIQEQRMKKRDALYLLKVKRLTRRLKLALFFAHTASRTRFPRDAATSNLEDRYDAQEWVPESPSDLEVVVRTTHYCQNQLEQLKGETDLRRKAAGLKETLTLLDRVG